MSRNLRLNQVTLGAKDMAASVEFYQNLGLTLIVDSAPRYVRLEFPDNDHGECATLSLHGVEEGWAAPADWPLIYFEVDDLPGFIAEKSLAPIAPPKMQSYLWEETDVIDPSGNRIRLYTAGDNRRFPPWRV